MASSSTPPPDQRAAEILNSLPSSPSLVTKTGTVVLGTGLLATAISQELYVVNEETVIFAGTFFMFAVIAKLLKEPYGEWAEANINKIKNILDKSRSEHTQAVRDRITSVEQMKDVVSLTEGLFSVSKETAQLEAESFVQGQKVALASEAKAVLDSWVRFEQQQKEAEQAELAKSVIAKVMAAVNDEKTQREILTAALAEMEQLVKNKAI
ncbi:ATP synthase [Athelia psychrophila]|uniref:ATP synthase subunit 4 n=1 Tax=Athelia psychrophila TaxID=1759441 RepID=A0A166RWB2_9AGAM|nr:ATP synthase [Fibularhizoctonia sp. CBS 109695]